MNRDLQLDVVRGLAIIAVVAIHTAQVSSMALVDSGYVFSWVDKLFRSAAEFGKYGVELFFFLSGVLLAKIYGRDSSLSLNGYIARRLGRILPLWYVFAFSSFLLYWIFSMGWWKGLLDEAGGGAVGQIQVVISTLFFITWALIPGTPQRAIPGGWSIESEMTHYALFPLVRKLSSTQLIALMAICGFLATLHDVSFTNNLLEGITLRLESLSIFTTFPFFLGGLLFVGWDKAAIRRSFEWKNLLFWAFSASGICLLMLKEVPFGFVSEAIFFAIAVFGVSYLLIKNKVMSKALSTIGKYSYFIYFFHFYVVAAFVAFQKTIETSAVFSFMSRMPFAFPILHFVYFSLALVAALLLGFLSYKYFENPILKRARRIK